MIANQYVNTIAKRIKCSSNKKRDIKQQLLTDINLRLEQGERLEDIVAHMGTAKEIADGFNENISEKEQKRYSRNKALKIIIPCVALLAAAVCFVYWVFPKSVDIEKSEYFNMTEVEEAMKNTVDLLDESDYTSLQENSIPQMQSVLNAETMENAKGQVDDNWGARNQFGKVYMVEIVQFNKHYAVGEITVSYDNTNVTYRLTYDEDMKLCGLYMR